MRKMQTFKFEQRPNEHGRTITVKVKGETGTFLTWGIDHIEYENGPGHMTTAIVEMQDGSIANFPTEMVQFIQEDKHHER